MKCWCVKFGKQTFLRHIKVTSDNMLAQFKCLDMLGLRFCNVWMNV